MTNEVESLWLRGNLRIADMSAESLIDDFVTLNMECLSKESPFHIAITHITLKPFTC